MCPVGNIYRCYDLALSLLDPTKPSSKAGDPLAHARRHIEYWEPKAIDETLALPAVGRFVIFPYQILWS
jgi:hypothetical protein